VDLAEGRGTTGRRRTEQNDMGQRYYDSSIGRWTQQDPLVSLVDPMQWNRYVYVGDDPVNYVDPSGMDSCMRSDNEERLIAVVMRSLTTRRRLWRDIADDPVNLSTLGKYVPMIDPK
jgi:RHS repeat-associated protein